MSLKKTVLAVFIAAALSACGNETAQSTPASEQGASQAASNASFTLNSKAGEITVPANVSRIAVLDINALSTIEALGETDKVVGLPKGTPLPAALEVFANDKYQDLGTAKEANLEKVASTTPEIIIMNGRMDKMMDQVKEIAPTYFLDVDYSNYMPSFKEQTLNMAKILGKTAEAEKQLAQLDADIADLKTKTAGKTALVVMVNNDKLAAYGAGSRFGNIHDLYGFTPIDSSIKVGLHGMAISPEFIAEKNPDYLFVIDRGAAITKEKDAAKAVLNNDFVNKTKAAQNNHIVYLDSANWYLTTTGLGGMKAMTKEVADAVK